MQYHLETCAGSLEDCLISERAGATRIELNSAVHMGGLTPSLGLTKQALEAVDIPIITMIRPRGGGFIYHEYDQKVMFEDAEILLKAGVAGLAFGFLTPELKIDLAATKKMVDLCHRYQAEAVFHRAFDRSENMISAIEDLIELGVDRVLTSGQKNNVDEGFENLQYLQKHYGHQIEICAGAGVNPDNIGYLVEKGGLKQVHGSFKAWREDVSTHSPKVSYQYHEAGDYEIVDYCQVKKAAEILNDLGK